MMFCNACESASIGPITWEVEEDILHRLVEAVRHGIGFRDRPQLRAGLAAVLSGLGPRQRRDWMVRIERGDLSSVLVQELIQRIAVHETYFFRDPQQLDRLRQDILPALTADKRRTGDLTYTVWSAGCSTGEEAYTLAMILLDHLAAVGEAAEVAPGIVQPLPGWRVRVIGTDICSVALERAQAGCYSDFGLSPFRAMPASYRRFFRIAQCVPPDFTMGGHVLEVRDPVRAVVEFSVHNLLGTAPPALHCDIACCRNVLIYLDAAGKQRAQDLLDRALRPQGVILFGGTDMPQLDHYRLLFPEGSPVLRKPA